MSSRTTAREINNSDNTKRTRKSLRRSNISRDSTKPELEKAESGTRVFPELYESIQKIPDKIEDFSQQREQKSAKSDHIDLGTFQNLLPNLTISVIRNLNNFLGESPFYQAETDRVYWVDILKGTLNYWHRTTGQIGRWDLKQKIGCAVAVTKNPNFFLIGTAKGPALFDIKTGTWIHTYNNPEHKLINNRWNDGKCGPDGIFWIGSMNGFNTEEALNEGLREGGLYFLDGIIDNPVLKKRLDYVGISNGLAWNRSGLLMYYIDSVSQHISEYNYRSSNTSTSVSITLSRGDLIKIPRERGTPDGCAMDRDDNLWVGLWNGSAIEQFSTKDGSLLQHIPLPDRFITSLAWFGPELDKLFVTSAMSDSLMEILDEYNNVLNNNNNLLTNSVVNTETPFSSILTRGRAYVIDFSKTNIRGLAVSGFSMTEFKG